MRDAILDCFPRWMSEQILAETKPETWILCWVIRKDDLAAVGHHLPYAYCRTPGMFRHVHHSYHFRFIRRRRPP